MDRDRKDPPEETPRWQMPLSDRQIDADAYHIWTPRPLLRSIYWKPETEPSREAVAASYEVFLDQRAFVAMHEHVWGAGGEAPFGWLVGDLCEDPSAGRRFIIVTGVIPSRFPFHSGAAAQDRAPDEAVVALRLEVERRRGVLVGWYRARSEGPARLSEAEVAEHENRFGEPWQVAFLFVTDPSSPAGACFRRTPDGFDGTMPMPFHEMVTNESLLAKGVRRSRLDWTNLSTLDEVRPEPPPRPAQAPASAVPPVPEAEAVSDVEEPAVPEPEAEEALPAGVGESGREEAGATETAGEQPGEIVRTPGTEEEPEAREPYVAGSEVVSPESEIVRPESAGSEADPLVSSRFDADVDELAEPRSDREDEVDGGAGEDDGEADTASEDGEPVDFDAMVAELLGETTPFALAGEERVATGPTEPGAPGAEATGSEEVGAGPVDEDEPAAGEDLPPEEEPAPEEEPVPGVGSETLGPAAPRPAAVDLDAPPEPRVEGPETAPVAAVATGHPGRPGRLRRRLAIAAVAVAAMAALVFGAVRLFGGGEEGRADRPVDAPARAEKPAERETGDGAEAAVGAGEEPGTADAATGAVGAPGGREGEAAQPDAASDTAGLAAPAEGADVPSTPPAVDPAADVTREQLEAMSDRVLEAVSRFYGRDVARERGEIGCPELQSAFVEVMDSWIDYSARGKQSWPGRLPPELAERDGRLYRGVQDVERLFEASGCPRP